jgi:flagellar basal body-associated protein FliL
MEARRTFQGEASGSKFWIIVAALIVVMALAFGGLYLSKGLSTSTAAPATKHVVLSGPGPMAPNVKDRDPEVRQTQQAPAVKNPLRPGYI